MNRTRCRILAVAGATFAAGLAACGDAGGDTTTTVASVTPSIAPNAPVAQDPTARLVGSGCADYAAVPEGAGSIAGMAKAPLTTAAGSNPLLTTLVSRCRAR